MYLFDVFRSFLPWLNPIGFGAADFIVLATTLLLAAFILAGPWIEAGVARVARRTLWCMVALAVLPVALRLALLWRHPVPTPDIYDEFSHLLEADTLRHFRLANSAHPMPQFFETFFVLQEPSYSSIYPMGPGLALAAGWLLFGHPWAGVLLSMAAFCALCYWMLRGWTSPGWALAGGALAVCEFGPLNEWTNGYWGGFVPAIAGCLVFGALPRLRAGPRRREALLLGAGLGLHWLARPFETIFLAAAVALFFFPPIWRRAELRPLLRLAPAAALPLLFALGLTLLQDKQVTGSWTTLPEMASQYQYGVPPGLTVQAKAVPHRPLTSEQAMDYRMQSSFQSGAETLSSYFGRMEARVSRYRFFFYAPLYLVLPVFLATIRSYRLAWVPIALLILALGVNFFPAFQSHYMAAGTSAFVLMSVRGLDGLSRLRVRGAPAGKQCAAVVLALCFSQFIFWYAMHVFDDANWSLRARTYETWDSVNHRNPARRIMVNRQLESIPGKLVVFVRYYYPQHLFQDEWVNNAADIDGARVVWARDLGAEEDTKLIGYYPDRKPMLLEPDYQPPRLTPYFRQP
jgi:hypothetical protein